MSNSTPLLLVSSGDPTAYQVRAQIDASGVMTFEVGIIPPRHRPDLKPERTRRFTAEKLCESKTISWLKFMNCNDRNIYCRPAPLGDGQFSPLVFVDDLSAVQIAKMEDSGLPLAIAVESSPQRFHGWVRVAARPVMRDEAQCLARMLARRFGGGAAAWNQYGRLSGFTNRKREHWKEAGAPFARLHAASRQVAPEGAALLAEARAELARRAGHPMLLSRAATGAFDTSINGADLDHVLSAFRAARAKVRACRPDGTQDESARDFGAACKLIEQGYGLAQVGAAILEGSPGLCERHSDPEDYARRTVDAAGRRALR
ncbi:MAG: RepB family DNA primase [Xanthobacteraceae bacterium]|nr:RepB family DNA primase [Xanthobacteraceae bacterium]